MGVGRTRALALAGWFVATGSAPTLVAPTVLQADPALSPPYAENSDYPCGINLVGTRNGVADPRGEVLFVLRNIGNNPVAGSSVVIDFCACVGTQGFCIALQQPDPDIYVSPDGCQVSGVTDGNGTLKISLVGHATTTPGIACEPEIYADGVHFTYDRSFQVGAFDLDGGQGVAPPDVSHWLDDSFAPQYRARADYDCSGTVTPVDLAKLLDVSIAGDSQVSAANAVCH